MRKSKARARLAERETFSGYMSLDIQTGSEKLRPEDLLQREVPGSINDACVRARQWKRDNWFVEQICLKREAFYNYGLKIAVRGAASKSQTRTLQKFLEDPEKKGALLRYIGEVWDEWILLDTVVSFWRKEKETLPFLLEPENCDYSDAFGIEKLKVRMDYKKKQLEDERKDGIDGLDPKSVRRYTGQNQILLSEEYDEYFKVLTRGRRGWGFGWPRLRTVFRTLTQNESMEVGEAMYALAGRLVERTHSLGFEVKGANALRQSEYLWKKKRHDEIMKWYQGHAAGLADTTRQFDHVTKLLWTDPALYDFRKWETVVKRLMWWGGPLAFMFVAQTPNPHLLPLLRTEAQREREKVKLHLEHVIDEGWRIGVPIELAWGDDCFFDLRLAWDMVRTFTQQGSLSLASGLRFAGFEPEKELENKDAERQDKERWMPLFDPAHGKRPGEPDTAGRPPSAAAPKPK